MATTMEAVASLPTERLGLALAHVGHAAKGGGDSAEWILVGDGRLEGFRLGLRVTVAVPELTGLPACLVSHGRLAAIVRETSGDVALTPGERTLGIRAGKGGRWTLATRSPDGWNAAKPEKAHPVFRLPADQLARCIEGTIDAADRDGTSRFGGVHIAVEDGGIVFVATDGRRMHVVAAEVDQAVDDCAVTIPASMMKVVGQLCREAGDAAVQITRTHAEATFEVCGTTVAAGLLSGTYPAWRRVMRALGTTTLVPAADLLAAVRQAAVVTSEESRGVAVKVDSGRGRCAIAAKSSEYGTATVGFRAAEIGGDAKVIVDPSFLSAWLRTVDPAGMVEVDFGDGSTSVAMRHDVSTAVVMPLSGTFSDHEFADV